MTATLQTEVLHQILDFTKDNFTSAACAITENQHNNYLAVE